MESTGKKLTDTNLPSVQYLAGFLDGEGCFRWNSPGPVPPEQGAPRLQVSNTYLPILKIFQSQWGGRISKKNDKVGKVRTCWEWRVDGEDCRDIMRAVLPYLVEKQEQVRLLLLAQGSHPLVRLPLIERCTELKRIDYGEAN